MIFSRRHYIWLASASRDILSRARQCPDSKTAIQNAETFIDCLATALENESSGFDRQQFLDNIYVSVVETKTQTQT